MTKNEEIGEAVLEKRFQAELDGQPGSVRAIQRVNPQFGLFIRIRGGDPLQNKKMNAIGLHQREDEDGNCSCCCCEKLSKEVMT